MPNYDRLTIGNEIKKARKNKKLSQFELAEMAGIDEKQIYRIEAGITSPKLEIFLKIANILDLKINCFKEVNTDKKYMREALELLNNATDTKRKIYYNVIRSLNENL